MLEESARNEESPQLPDGEADEAADNQGFLLPSEEVNGETLGEELDIDAGSNASDEMETDTEEDTECGRSDLHVDDIETDSEEGVEGGPSESSTDNETNAGLCRGYYI